MGAGAAVESTGTREASILDAARAVFERYGYAQTSMERVAREAGLSRAGLYNHFPRKEALFRAAVADLHARTLASARERRDQLAGAGVEARLLALFESRHGWFFERFGESPHVAELITESERICADVGASAEQRFRALVAAVLRDADEAGEIDLGHCGFGSRVAADLVTSSVEGLKRESTGAVSPRVFRERLAKLVAVLVRGLGFDG